MMRLLEIYLSFSRHSDATAASGIFCVLLSYVGTIIHVTGVMSSETGQSEGIRG